LIFISSIIIISIIGNIKSKSKKISLFKGNGTLFSKSYSHISAIFSLEIILIFVYTIIFVFFCLEYFDEIKIIERVILFLLLTLQFLHLIYCVIIPVYLKEFKYIINSNEDEDESMVKELYFIKSNYIGAICISYIFLIILLFFDFILFIDYNKIFNVEVLLKYLGENLCQGFNKKDNVDQNKKNEIIKKNKIIKDIFANELRDEIKNLKEKFNYKYI
jgi:glucan phosphoethanolaminetransferase (alkaline phosphatase superfamily)